MTRYDQLVTAILDLLDTAGGKHTAVIVNLSSVAYFRDVSQPNGTGSQSQTLIQFVGDERMTLHVSNSLEEIKAQLHEPAPRPNERAPRTRRTSATK
jgi:hypothetical protein